MSDPPTAFDMDLDAPLTQEEEIVLSQIEAQHTVVSHGLDHRISYQFTSKETEA